MPSNRELDICLNQPLKMRRRSCWTAFESFTKNISHANLRQHRFIHWKSETNVFILIKSYAIINSFNNDEQKSFPFSYPTINKTHTAFFFWHILYRIFYFIISFSLNSFTHCSEKFVVPLQPKCLMCLYLMHLRNILSLSVQNIYILSLKQNINWRYREQKAEINWIK